eukprot:scaffold10671_cov131-Cylindrotheca_fusiformis.AAC.10
MDMAPIDALHRHQRKARGERGSGTVRWLQQDVICWEESPAEDISNDRDISNDAMVVGQSNIFDRGTARRRAKEGGKAAGGKAGKVPKKNQDTVAPVDTMAPQSPFPTVVPHTPVPTAAPQTPVPTAVPQTPVPTAAPQTPVPTAAPVVKGGKAGGKAGKTSKKNRDSFSPTAAPQSVVPTVAPQSTVPTAAPQSAVPTVAPQTPVPTAAPVVTCLPTKSPTRNPTLSPSTSPVVVAMTPPPTNKPFETNTTDHTAISTCIDDPSDAGTIEDFFMAFKYNLYVTPGANQTSAIKLVEMFLHYGIAEEFLRCDFEEGDPYFVLSVESNRNATLLEEDCDTTNDPVPPVVTDCLVILSNVDMTVFYPSVDPSSDWIGTPDIQNATDEYLNSSMADGDFVWGDVVQTTYQGFFEDDNTTAAGGVIGREAAVGGSSVMVGSGLLAGLAALCLLIVMLLAAMHRRRKNTTALKQADGLNEANTTYSLEGEDTGLESLSSEGKVQRVLNDDFGFGTEGSHEFLDQPNVHQCSSATCPVCNIKGRGPTFLSMTENDGGGVQWHNTPRNSHDTSDDSLDSIDF